MEKEAREWRQIYKVGVVVVDQVLHPTHTMSTGPPAT